MDRKAEFLVKLRETFRVEAAEHIEAMTASLGALEHATDIERPPIIERIFREVHSLKGAARSVSLAGVEALCQELESVFAAAKRGALIVSTDVHDAVYRALAVLETTCANPGAPSSPEHVEQEQQALAALRHIVQGIVEPRAEPSAVAAPQSREPQAPLAAALPAAPDTVRVSMQKLNAILLEAEELIGARIAAMGRAVELRELAADLTSWNQRRAGQAARRRQAHGRPENASTQRESDVFYTRTIEHSLRKLAASAYQDALSLAAVTNGILDGTRNVLMLPCSYLLGTQPKMLRDLAREMDKQADLRIHGEDIEIDRRVLDELKDPLTHLLRNAVDHGIENPDARRRQGKPASASIAITVTPVEGNRVEFAVSDDGAGIDVDKVRQAAVRSGLIQAGDGVQLADVDVVSFIFHSGLSTSPIVTDLSGRGLGLAIAREKVEKLGGTISVTSTRGVGTTFRLLVPVSLATFRGVFIGDAGQRFVIPTAGVERVIRIRPDEIKTVENRRTVALNETAVSVVRLRDALQLSGPDGRAAGAAYQAVIVRAADRRVAFLVDEVHGEQEVVVKPLGRQLVRVRNIDGAAISGSGTVIPILNVADLVESASTARAPGSEQDRVPERRRRLLIAEDSITARTLVKSILEEAGYEVVATVDGLDALTRLKSERFDLVVSDVDMPRMNGFELTLKIRADQKLSGVPVVLVTALGSPKDRAYGIEVGANAYIAKSDFDQGNLLETIERLL